MSRTLLKQSLQSDTRYRFVYKRAREDALLSQDGYFCGLSASGEWVYVQSRKGAGFQVIPFVEIEYVEPTVWRRRHPRPRVYERLSPAIRLRDDGSLDMMATLQTLFTASA